MIQDYIITKYASLITENKIRIDEVPELYRDEVIKLIKNK